MADTETEATVRRLQQEDHRLNEILVQCENEGRDPKYTRICIDRIKNTLESLLSQ